MTPRPRAPRTVAELELRRARARIAREHEEREGERPSILETDRLLLRHWYRLSEPAAELLFASAARRHARAHRRAQLRTPRRV